MFVSNESIRITQKLDFFTEVKVPIISINEELITNFRCDLFIENCLIVELKSALEMNSIFESQLLTYLRLLKGSNGIITA